MMENYHETVVQFLTDTLVKSVLIEKLLRAQALIPVQLDISEDSDDVKQSGNCNTILSNRSSPKC